MLGVETAPDGVHRAGLSLAGTTYILFGAQCLWMSGRGPQRPCWLMVGQQRLAVQAGVGGHLTRPLSRFHGSGDQVSMTLTEPLDVSEAVVAWSGLPGLLCRSL